MNYAGLIGNLLITSFGQVFPVFSDKHLLQDKHPPEHSLKDGARGYCRNSINVASTRCTDELPTNQFSFFFRH